MGQLERALGYSRGYISRLESSDRSPRATTLEKLAAVLRCRTAYLVSGELPMADEARTERYPNRERAIARMADKWPRWLVEQLRSIALLHPGDPSVDAWLMTGRQLELLAESGGRALTAEDDEQLGTEEPST